MSRCIVLTSKHELGVEIAKQRLSERFEALKAAWIDKVGSAEMTWTGDVAHVNVRALGQTATAEIDVKEHDLTITIELSMMLAPFRNPIEAFLKDNADVLQSPPKKT